MLLITLSDNLTLHLKPMPGIDYIKTFLYQSNKAGLPWNGVLS